MRFFSFLLIPVIFTSCGTTENIKHIIYENSFSDSKIGLYTKEQLYDEWDFTTNSIGIEEARVSVVEDEDKNRVFSISYPKNNYGIQNTGAQWKLSFNHSYNEAYISYSIKFSENFDFVKGGKLPGLAGGSAPSGGNASTGTNGWSGRIMWRSDGRIVQYMYYPDMSGTYGEDFPWDIDKEHYFKPNIWYKIKNHFVMNTPGKNDGVIQAWLDDVLVLDRHDIRFRDVDSFGIDLFYFSTFFGGNNQTWATSKDETILFDDFKIYL